MDKNFPSAIISNLQLKSTMNHFLQTFDSKIQIVTDNALSHGIVQQCSASKPSRKILRWEATNIRPRQQSIAGTMNSARTVRDQPMRVHRRKPSLSPSDNSIDNEKYSCDTNMGPCHSPISVLRCCDITPRMPTRMSLDMSMAYATPLMV